MDILQSILAYGLGALIIGFFVYTVFIQKNDDSDDPKDPGKSWSPSNKNE